MPILGCLRAVVDIIPQHHYFAPISHGALVEVCRGLPVFIKCECFCDLHPIDTTACRSKAPASHSNDPVIYPSTVSDGRLTCRKRTRAMERIRSKSEVSIYYVHVDFGHALAVRGRSCMNRLSLRPIRILKLVTRALDRSNDAISVPGNDCTSILF